jgi:hypothetical protein
VKEHQAVLFVGSSWARPAAIGFVRSEQYVDDGVGVVFEANAESVAALVKVALQSSRVEDESPAEADEANQNDRRKNQRHPWDSSMLPEILAA